MNISLPKFSVSSLTKNFKENVNSLFLIMLIGLIVCELYVINNSVQTLIRFEAQGHVEVKAKGVKVNFTAYDEVVKEIDDAENYNSQIGQLKNPFSAN